ncbi:MAG: hypothetical protein H6Q62_105 [Firmicutes bacterium]|nr:hypothetical protein [Bacillota bacterium]
MRIGIYTNPNRDIGCELSRQLATLISRHGATPVVDEVMLGVKFSDIQGVDVADYSTSDILICLGGDGTFLSAVHLSGCQDIPIIGVNLGSVGFLLEIKPENIESDIQRLIAGDYYIERRMMLSVNCFDQSGQLIESGLSMNDAVVSRGGKSRILTLDLTIDGVVLERIPGDGMIISTPTGSTAYSLSSGGPIVHPQLELMIITPICPHTLHNRSYLTSSTSEVVIEIIDYPYQALLAIDGRRDIYLNSGSRVVIGKADRYLQLIRLGPDNFFADLPEKIHLRGKTR